MNAEPLLTLVARLLAARKLDAVLIGNAAAAIQGSPVTTMDLDFMFRKTPANLTKLKRLADDLDAVVLSPFYPASQRYRITRGAWGSRSVIKPKAISYGASWSVRPSSALPPPPEKLGNLHQRPSGLLEMAATATAERSPTERHERLDRLAETIARAHFNPEEPFDPSGLRTAALNYAEGAVSMTADQLLTHYTTDGGLRGILDSGVIWATRTRDQSDHREVEYRNGLIWHASQALPRLSRADRRFAAQLNLELEHPTNTLDAFAVSFCEDGDSPRLWRDYGDDGRGFALTFDPKRWVVPNAVQFMEMRIEYDAGVQELILGVFTNAMRRAFSRLLNLPSPPEPASIKTIYYDAFANMTIMCQAFKAPHFQLEREWRAVYLEYEGQTHMRIPTNVRRVRGGEVRYALIPLHDGKAIRLPLTATPGVRIDVARPQ